MCLDTPRHCLPTVVTVMPTVYTKQRLNVCFGQKIPFFCERSHHCLHEVLHSFIRCEAGLMQGSAPALPYAVRRRD
ncbi:hypothetical protein CSQ86_03910 [Bifidobacterium felsineum]|uniref:Uncharacterized protein n=1 Tax=Bifidobacterium felsineum TaxID=2045440 RepID=A0A2M9HJR0_9BIFI|nr:hypothetical protein CSQ86_03910 [Bifidobacterium felsineum]